MYKLMNLLKYPLLQPFHFFFGRILFPYDFLTQSIHVRLHHVRPFRIHNDDLTINLQCTQLEKALKMCKKTIEAEPENATYLDTYAWILFVSKKYDEAKTFIDRTLQHAELNSENYTLFDHAGDIYFHIGERTQAVDFWKKALSVCPDAVDARKLRRKIRYRRP